MSDPEIAEATGRPWLRHPNVRLMVRDFGPVAEGEVELRPLTVFVGPSNTGKTCLAILIYALHRVSGGFPRLPLLPHFPYWRFGSPIFRSRRTFVPGRRAREAEKSESPEILQVAEALYNRSAELQNRLAEAEQGRRNDPRNLARALSPHVAG